MIGSVILMVVLAPIFYIIGKYLMDKKFYWDLAIVSVFSILAVYYALAYTMGWDIYNPLDAMLWIIEPISRIIFLDLLR